MLFNYILAGKCHVLTFMLTLSVLETSLSTLGPILVFQERVTELTSVLISCGYLVFASGRQAERESFVKHRASLHSLHYNSVNTNSQCTQEVFTLSVSVVLSIKLN